MRSRIFPQIIVFCFLFLCISGYSQTDRQELERRRIELQREIKRINDLRTSNLRKEKSILNEVEDLDQKIRATENLIKVTNQQANLLTREISTNQKKIGQLREELKELKEDYAQMIQRTYRSQSQKSRIMFLLSSETFLQAYKRLQYMEQYADYRKQQGDGIKKRTIELQDLNKSLAAQKKTKESLIVENRQTRAQLQKAKEEQQSLIALVREKESQFAAELREKQEAINKIDQEIERIIAASIAKNNEGSSTASSDVFELTPEARALAASFASNKGKLPWPVKSGMLSMHYGKQRHPIVKSVTINSNGVRVDTEKGGKAMAIFGGTVSEIQAVKGANKAIMVRHGDYISIYNNLSEIYVSKGEKVSIGQELGVIATSPSTGKTTLHFLLYKNTQKLNPEEWIYEM